MFEFFSNAQNLERITPPYLSFCILTPVPIEMRSGTLIDYALKLHGVPVRWRTEITEYEPDERFVDVQLEGPYAVWHHLHEFVEVPEGTEIRDTVHYRLPLDPVGRVALPWVRRSLNAIFDYRASKIRDILGG